MQRDEIVNDIQGALAMIGQAQERAPHLSSLWHRLGQLFDELDTEQSMVQGLEYDEEGKLV